MCNFVYFLVCWRLPNLFCSFQITKLVGDDDWLDFYTCFQKLNTVQWLLIAASIRLTAEFNTWALRWENNGFSGRWKVFAYYFAFGSASTPLKKTTRRLRHNSIPDIVDRLLIYLFFGLIKCFFSRFFIVKRLNKLELISIV